MLEQTSGGGILKEWEDRKNEKMFGTVKYTNAGSGDGYRFAVLIVRRRTAKQGV